MIYTSALLVEMDKEQLTRYGTAKMKEGNPMNTSLSSKLLVKRACCHWRVRDGSNAGAVRQEGHKTSSGPAPNQRGGRHASTGDGILDGNVRRERILHPPSSSRLVASPDSLTWPVHDRIQTRGTPIYCTSHVALSISQ